MKNVRKKLLAFGLAGCLTVSSLVGISAYFTDGDTAMNTFTVGKVSIDLAETNYPGNDTDETANITPLQEIAKNPTITNDGDNDAYVFMTVTIPVVKDGVSRGYQYYTQMFTFGYEENGVGYSGVRSGWFSVGGTVNVNGQPLTLTLVMNAVTKDKVYISNLTSNATLSKYFAALEKDDDGNVVSVTYLFAYATDKTSLTCVALAPGETTTAPFDYVKLANFVEDQGLEVSAQDIVINAYAIQATNVNESATYRGINIDGKRRASDVWKVLYNANPATTVDVAENATTDEKEKTED
jgi:hypothetical protein